MATLQQNNDRKYLAFASRRLKQIANKLDDTELQDKLRSYSKEILDISSRMISHDDFIGSIVRGG